MEKKCCGKAPPKENMNRNPHLEGWTALFQFDGKSYRAEMHTSCMYTCFIYMGLISREFATETRLVSKIAADGIFRGVNESVVFVIQVAAEEMLIRVTYEKLFSFLTAGLRRAEIFLPIGKKRLLTIRQSEKIHFPPYIYRDK